MSGKTHPWGVPPWAIDFRPKPCVLPDQVDLAIVGGGFTGLSAAAWLRKLAPEKSVLVVEASSIGEGTSGCTGGHTSRTRNKGLPLGFWGSDARPQILGVRCRRDRLAAGAVAHGAAQLLREGAAGDEQRDGDGDPPVHSFRFTSSQIASSCSSDA